jgi:uncharacterized protein (DUF1684 family)
MRKARLAAALLFGLLSIAAVALKSPQDEWNAELKEANLAYAKIPHAILKIQDAAYLADGQTATLTGVKGHRESYRWVPGKSDGLLVAKFSAGHMSAKMAGKAIDDATLRKALPIDADVEITGFSTQVSAGVMGVRILVYNQRRAEALNFKGLDYFPYNPAYRITTNFKQDPRLPPRVFRTSRGTDKQFFHAGDATFVLNGKTFTLPFYADSNDPKKLTDMSAFFIDDLTGKGTYGAGRYVDISNFGSFPPKTATIDFNFAYNPNCARSPFYTCPVATDMIATAVRAGERDPHTAH